MSAVGFADRAELILPGTQLGKYKIVHRIAFGGMAEIYLARATGIQGFEKYLVLKRILPQYAENEEFVRMFLREARVAAALDHPNIAHVYDIGESGGTYFFTMEYLHGEDVRTIAKELSREKKGVPLEHAVNIAIGAAAGLHFAHERKSPEGKSLGIVHRDMSPSNIVVTYAGSVKVVDFGVAKLAADPDLSRRYSLKGKLAYMAPEQLEDGSVDRRSDIFALGTVLYELATRSRLFKGHNEVDTIKAVLEPVPPPSTRVQGFPAGLERIIMRALERDPANRYQTARELQVDLEAFAREQRLQISSAALAEWMESTFGPKQEIWHTLTLASGPTSSISGSGGPADPTAATRVVPHRHVSPSQAALSPVARDGAVDVSMVFTSVRPRRRRLATLGVLLALVAGGGAAFALRRGAGAAKGRPDTAGENGAIVVVAETGNVAIERRTGTAPPASAQRAAVPAPVSPPAPAVPAPAAAPTAATTAPAPAAGPAAKQPHHGHAATRAPAGGEAFSASFARHEPEIRRCFTDFQDQAAGEPISLRFQAERDGHVTSVTVLPPAVGNAPLGACLVKVGSRTVFSPQPEPVTFRIPLTVQVQRHVDSR